MSQVSPLEQSAFIDSADFPCILDPIQQFFSSRGVTAFIVGGAVRDALLGRKTEDIDIAVQASIDDILELGEALANALNGSYVVLDRARGTVRIVLDDEQVLDISAAPDGLNEDLKRRDFTVNAMAVPLAEVAPGTSKVLVTDLLGGVDDLAAKVIRMASPSVFDEDAVRLMRGPRLAAQLGFSLSDDARIAIRRDAELLRQSSPERVRDELLKLLAATDAMSSVSTLDDLRLLSIVIPELDEARDVSQPKEHYWDVFNHSVETVGQVERILGGQKETNDWVAGLVPTFPDMDSHFAERISDGHSRLTLLKLVGLLHDIAKPTTKTIEETGRIRFFGHHEVGAEIVGEILDRLRVGMRGRQFVKGLVRHHLRPNQMAEPGKLPTRRATYRYYRDLGDGAISTLYLNMADYLAARGPLLKRDEWQKHCDLIAHILDGKFGKSSVTLVPKLITGSEVIEEFSVEPGPLIGTLLEAVREAHAAGDISTRDDAIQFVGQMLITKR